MFEFIKNMFTATNHSSITPSVLSTTYICGHKGRIGSPYLHMAGPAALDAYLEYIGTTRCAECAAVERNREMTSETSPATGGQAGTALRPAA